MSRGGSLLISVYVAVIAAASGSTAVAGTQQASDAPAASPQRALLDRYCVTCHNEKLQTAGLTLDTMDLANVGTGAEVWEKVVKKLRAGAMPPVGRPRPDKATHDGFVTWLETELDRAAVAMPNPGRTATFHRLNRTEYENVIRDLLAIEVDASSLLPPDDAAYGFDNIGGLLSVSPDLLDRYLSAAGRVSRLAVGDPAMGLGSASYSISKKLHQDDRMSEDLPFGSRGGTAIRHYFPYDGEYDIRVRFNGSARLPQVVELRVDGERMAEWTTEGRSGLDPEEKGAVQARITVKAGPRVVGVSFVKQTLEFETRFPQYYPWGHSAVFGTTVGAADYVTVLNVDIGGPYQPQGPGDTPSRRRIFVCEPVSRQEEDPCARKILAALARRAFRRPVTDADVEPLMRFYRAARDEQRDFNAALQPAVERLLADPDFLFRVERDPVDGAFGVPYQIEDDALASRLSFFLWSSIPDDELLEVAERGELSNPAVLQQQVSRMLADERAQALVTDFAAQWLYLRNVSMVTPDSFEFPDWDDDLRAAVVEETVRFLDSQLREDRPVHELLTANYTFLNERLARHYGIRNVYGGHFRRVEVNDARRAGLLGHASILMVTSFANRTSPVVRGKWLLENFLNYEPPPPPPNIPDLEENGQGQVLSLRERLEQHRASPVCAGCHAVMDPLGFSLENFDAIGRWRDRADGVHVNASGSLPDGTLFDGPSGLGDVMEIRREAFVRTVTEKLLTYALGRGLEYYDTPTVRQIVREAGPNFEWSAIIKGITESVPFQMRVRRVEQ